MKYYAIKKGYQPGIYTTWTAAQQQISGFKGAIHKSFKTENEAKNYLAENCMINVNHDFINDYVKAEDNFKLSKTQNKKDITILIENGDIIAKNNKNTDKNGNSILDNDDVNGKNKSKKGKTIKYRNGEYKPILKEYDTVVYTDGSSVNGIGGYGFVILTPTITDGKVPLTILQKQYGHLKTCTNQAAELNAIYHALLYLKSINLKGKILIRSDSEYSIKSLTVYLNNWKRNGYMTIKKEPIKNKDLIINISNLLDTPNVTFEHIISHEGEYYNEMADKLADQGVNDTTEVVAAL